MANIVDREIDLLLKLRNKLYLCLPRSPHRMQMSRSSLVEIVDEICFAFY